MLSEMQRFLAGLRRAINQPFQELNRWQRAARFAYDLGRYGARQLKQDRAPQMAAALAFRTLFGLAPILVVTTILIKTIKGPEVIIATVRSMLVAAGLDKLQVGAVPGAGEDATVAPMTLAQWLENLTGQLVNADMSTAGLVGLVVIIYAAIGLMVTIENSFNIIYRAPDGRSWTRRVPLYWFVLTISPVMIGVASYVNGRFTGWFDTVETWHGLLLAARFVWSYGITCLLISAVYLLVPNTTVAVRPALAGGLIATLLLGAGKNTFGAYLGNAFSINQLYGSLGLVPLFMFWVYLMWLAVLFGLEVSAILQMLQGRSIDEMDPPRMRTGLVSPTSVLTVMEAIAEHFVAGRTATVREVAEDLSLPEATISRIIERLVQEGWLHRVEHPAASVSLARPPELMDATQFLAIGFRMLDENGPGRTSALDRQLREAQQAAANGVNLAMLVPASG